MFLDKKPISINAIKKLPFTGNYQGMRYRLERIEQTEGEETKQILSVCTYPWPYSYPHTDPAKIATAEFDFSDDGYTQAVEWLNNQYDTRKDFWEKAKHSNILDG